jgi:hypothetical protein
VYTGLAFNDTNESGSTLSELNLSGQGFTITGAFQEDATGDVISGSSFSNGILTFGDPIGIGEAFFFDVTVSNFLNDQPMIVTASQIAEPSSLGVLWFLALVYSLRCSSYWLKDFGPLKSAVLTHHQRPAAGQTAER